MKFYLVKKSRSFPLEKGDLRGMFSLSRICRGGGMPPVSHRETPNNTPRYFIFAVCYGAFRGVLLTVKNNGGSFQKQRRLFSQTMARVF